MSSFDALPNFSRGRLKGNQSGARRGPMTLRQSQTGRTQIRRPRLIIYIKIIKINPHKYLLTIPDDSRYSTATFLSSSFKVMPRSSSATHFSNSSLVRKYANGLFLFSSGRERYSSIAWHSLGTSSAVCVHKSLK